MCGETLESIDYAVIGGGLVGLATARALKIAEPHANIVLLEKEAKAAQHQSGRNSGVLHSGVYYPKGSQKADLCIRGRHALIEYCKERGIVYKLCGKVIVAHEEDQISELEALADRGRTNGLATRVIDQAELKEIEPYAKGLAAVWVPETGIVDFSAVAKALVKELNEMGIAIKFGYQVHSLSVRSNSLEVSGSRGKFNTGYAINCAGLHSDRVARLAGIRPKLRIVPFRGQYFKFAEDQAHLLRALIYPLNNPKLPFLGVHLTRTISGEVLAGPNALLSFKREGYQKGAFALRDFWETLSYPGFWRLAAKNLHLGAQEMLRSWSAKSFARDVGKLLESFDGQNLIPIRSGVRAQAVDIQGNLVSDFQFEIGDRSLHVLNAPSPAATASLAIGEFIANKAIQLG